MARPLKEGVDYFPLDCDMDTDTKVAFIEAKHGIVGFGVWLKLLSRIYRDHGYWLEWSETEQYVFARSAGVDREKAVEVVADCLSVGLLDKDVFETHGVLTSKGIQDRFKAITKGRRNSGEKLQYGVENGYSDENPAEEVVSDADNPTDTPLSDGLIRKAKQSKAKQINSSRNPVVIGGALRPVERAMTAKFGDKKTAAAWPFVVEAIESGCPPGCKGLHCQSEPCIGLVLTVVSATTNPAKLPEFIRQRRKT